MGSALGSGYASKILHVGCGNSKMGRKLHDAGFTDVTNVDYSDVVIDMMRKKEPQLRWVCADCTVENSMGTEVYDCCIDKGAIDSLFEAGSDAMWARGEAMVAEVHRSLKHGGRYLVISNGGVGNPVLQDHF